MTKELIKLYINENYQEKFLIKRVNSFRLIDKTYNTIQVSEESSFYIEAKNGPITIKMIELCWDGKRILKGKNGPRIKTRINNTNLFNYSNFLIWQRNRIIDLVMSKI
jgi:hypothetical protein